MENLEEKQAWLEERRNYIGGSDVAAILGVSRYKTALQVFEEKKGIIPPFEGNKFTKAGNMLEDTIAKWYMDETNNKVIRDNKTRFHKDFPFMAANIDRLILSSSEYGETGILEIKTASTYSAKQWDEEPPIEYQCQLQHYLDVTGHSYGEFAVLLGGVDFRRYKVNRDDDFIALKNKKLCEFWNDNFLSDVPPAPVCADDIQLLYATVSNGKIIEASADTLSAIDQLRMIKERMKELEAQEEKLKTQIQLVMCDADTLNFQGETVATWKMSKPSMSFDSKTFQKENKDLYEKYIIEKMGSRRFLIK